MTSLRIRSVSNFLLEVASVKGPLPPSRRIAARARTQPLKEQKDRDLRAAQKSRVHPHLPPPGSKFGEGGVPDRWVGGSSPPYHPQQPCCPEMMRNIFTQNCWNTALHCIILTLSLSLLFSLSLFSFLQTTMLSDPVCDRHHSFKRENKKESQKAYVQYSFRSRDPGLG